MRRRPVKTPVRTAAGIAGNIVSVLLVFIICCNIYLFAAGRFFGKTQPTVFGYSAAVMVSGSMEPALSVDDLIIIKAGQEYKTGDIITFVSGENMVTHRIVGETEAGFITKGDANNTEDTEPVSADSIIGEVAVTVPGIGKYIGAMRTPLGMTIMVFAGLILLKLPCTGFSKRKCRSSGNRRKRLNDFREKEWNG